MITVIGEAKDVKQRIICNHCAAILEYTKSDVQVFHGIDYTGGPDGREWIECPRCVRDVILRAW